MSQPLRILLVAPTLKPESGWGTYARSMVKSLSAEGHTCICLLQHADTSISCTQETGLPSPLALLSSKVTRLKTAWLIRRAVRKHRPDIVHFLVEPYTLAMPLVERFTRVPPWAMNLHGTYVVQPFADTTLQPIFQRVYEECHGFFVCSEYTRMRTLQGITDYASESLAQEADARMYPFRFGIEKSGDSTFVHPPQHEKRILFVGEVKPRKGVLELIQATIAYHSLATTPWRLDIIGGFKEGDPYIQELRSLIQKHQLENTIILRGHVSDAELTDAYSKADLFMMLSKNDGLHFEGFGLVFLEANSRGIPTIGSNDSGCKEAIDEGKTGYAVDAKDPEAIATKMQWILEEGRIKREDCFAWAKKHSLEQQAQSAVQMYRTILQQKS